MKIKTTIQKILFWRTYCGNCGFHLKEKIWNRIDGREDWTCVCARCTTPHEKFTQLDEDGFRRWIRILGEKK